MIWEWNITKCRAKYKGHKEANYTFWIVDYFREEDVIAKPGNTTFGFLDKHIIDFRNEGVVKVRYFFKEEEAIDFIKGLKKKGGE